MDVKNPALIPLFEEAKAILAPYAEHFTVRVDEPGRFELWSEKDVEVNGKKRAGVHFAGLIIQKSYVGFYYMPVYVEAEIATMFGAELLRLLKGKSCFYLKALTPTLREQIVQALDAGLALYREREWVD